MCGIAGIISGNSQLVQKCPLKDAAGALAHRGPEGEGFYHNESSTAALAHRRLCIIDLSPAAAQPFTYLERYHIVHNGELYNYSELKEKLKSGGYSFRTTSDTEVIVAAYAAWGPECLQEFEGMFAFAIWDEKEQVLFAARDRFGEKPFFFFYDEEKFLFASEIKALWQMGVHKEVNNSMLYNFLTIGYTTNPSDSTETLYSHIRKLPAAYYLLYAVSKKELSLHQYWQVYTEVDETISEAKAIEQFEHLFHSSIQKRLRSDVAIGTSLSGGLDSSAIVAFCHRHTSANYTHKCFTTSFSGFEKDELHHAQTVAQKFGLEHHVTTVHEGEVTDLMEKLMHHQDEPIVSSSPLAQYKVYGMARQAGVTVLLDGQGADEVLGGYHKYYKWWWQELYRQRKLKKSGELKKARALGVTEPFGLQHKLASTVPHLAAALLQSRKAKQAYRTAYLNRDWAYTQKQNFYYSLPAAPGLNDALYFNTFVHGLEELLRLADRNSMAHSVEVRLPFLSHELVSFLFTLPPHFKIHEGWTKWLLRKSTGDKLPKEIVWRKDKVGFEPPQREWMKNSKVQEAIQSAKAILVKKGILNASVLHKKIQPHEAHAAENIDWKIWSAGLLMNQ